MRARAVVVAASCLESARIMLNSKSPRWPDGIANSSGQLGRNSVRPPLRRVGQRTPAAVAADSRVSPTTSATTRSRGCRAGRISKNPHEEKFVGGYSVYPGGGCYGIPVVRGAGRGLRLGATNARCRRRYPTPVSFTIQAPSLPSPTNYLDLDPKVTDRLWNSGGAAAFQVGRERARRCGSTRSKSSPELIRAAGGVYESAAQATQHARLEPARSRHLPDGQRPEALRHQSLRSDARRPESLRVRRQRLSELRPTRRRRSASWRSRCAPASTCSRTFDNGVHRRV